MENIVGALITVAAGILVFWVGQVSQRRSDAERRKAAADDRRREQGEQVAREVRKELLAAAALLSEEAGESRAGDRKRWNPPTDDELEAHTHRAKELAFDIPDPGVKAFVKFAAYALDHSDIIMDIGGPNPWELARDVETETNGVIGAYVHGDPLPDAPKVRVANQAIEQHWKQLDEWAEERRQERLAKREAKLAAEAEPRE